jgi:hypothetical protein
MGTIRKVNSGYQIFDKSGKSLTYTIPDLATAKRINLALRQKAQLSRRKIRSKPKTWGW